MKNSRRVVAMKACPFCNQELPDNAAVCQSCNRDLTTAPASAQPVRPIASRMALASLILSVFSVLVIPGILAIGLGHAARWKIKRSGGRLRGKGIALAGLILGYLGIAYFPFAMHYLVDTRADRNQAAAVGSLRWLNQAAFEYDSAYHRGFPKSLSELGPGTASQPPSSSAAGLVDESLASGRKLGYTFTYKVIGANEHGFPNAYTLNADPEAPGGSGNRHFYTDQSTIIREETARAASKESAALPD